MGFPSSATDYVERTLAPEVLCGITANSLVIEKSDDWAIVERGMRPQKRRTLLANLLQSWQTLRSMARSVDDTNDGEALAGEAFDEVEVVGVVTHVVIDLQRDDCPAMLP